VDSQVSVLGSQNLVDLSSQGDGADASPGLDFGGRMLSFLPLSLLL
jgi:hypothetical protein